MNILKLITLKVLKLSYNLNNIVIEILYNDLPYYHKLTNWILDSATSHFPIWTLKTLWPLFGGQLAQGYLILWKDSLLFTTNSITQFLLLHFTSTMRQGKLILWLDVFFIQINMHEATTRHRYTRKRSTKRLKYTKSLFRKHLQSKDVC